MPSVIESQKLLDNVVRLRRAERVPEVAAEIAPVRADLETRLGPTLSRSRASRMLGVSQTALDRWVSAGEVPVLLTPRGRLEVPRQVVIELAEQIDDLRRQGQRRGLLSTALRRRRERAEQVRRLLGPQRASSHPAAFPRSHRTAEERSLAYHRIVASRLDQRLVADARQRLQWLTAEHHVHPRYAERWEEILSRPLPEIAEVLVRDDDEGHDLRQNSPFAGVLNEHERREIIEAVR